MKNYKFENYLTDSEQLARCTNKPYANVYELYATGRISQQVFEAYCWLWRNSTYHYGIENIQYEGKPISDNLYDLVSPYFHMVKIEFFVK